MNDMEMIKRINRYCLEQKKESADFHDEYHEGIWLMCSYIHKFIVTDGKDKLEIVKRE